MSVVILGFLALGVSLLYASESRSLDEQAERMLLDSHLRSQMEVLLATDVSALASGSNPVSVRGRSYAIAWSVAAVDLDGDATPEADAMQVTVFVQELPTRSLTSILVDHGGQVGKIP
jgi:hypothetical protein